MFINNLQITPSKHIHTPEPSQFLPLTSTHSAHPSIGLMQSFGTSQVDLALSGILAQSLTSPTQPLIQPESDLPLESSADAEAESKFPYSSLAILSNLRHVAARHPRIVRTFEEQTREFFIRENAPSPEPRLTHSNQPPAEVDLQPADSGYHQGGDDTKVNDLGQWNIAPSYSHPLMAPITAESINPIRPQLLRSDAEPLSKALHPIEQTPTIAPIAKLGADEQQDDLVSSINTRPQRHAVNFAQPHPDTEGGPQSPCEELSAISKAKGKQKAIEFEPELEASTQSDSIQNWPVSTLVVFFLS